MPDLLKGKKNITRYILSRSLNLILNSTRISLDLVASKYLNFYKFLIAYTCETKL